MAMSTSVSHLTDDLFLLSSPRASQTRISSADSVQLEQSLQSLLLSLKPPVAHARIDEAIQLLQNYESTRASTGVETLAVQVSEEEQGLKNATVGRIIVGLYAEALDTFLKEAMDAEVEAEWWADIERSSSKVWYYLVQTLPSRLVGLLQSATHALHSQNRTFNLSVLRISSLRSLLSGRETARPNILAASLFPHLHTHPHMMPLTFSLRVPSFYLQALTRPPSSADVTFAFKTIHTCLSSFIDTFFTFFGLPFELTRQECFLKCKELERIRDERAQVLGELASRRDRLASVLLLTSSSEAEDNKITFLRDLDSVVSGKPIDIDVLAQGSLPILSALHTTSRQILPEHKIQHGVHLRSHALLRPSRMTLLWPRLVLLPPLTLLLIREVYASKESLVNTVWDIWDTAKGFWRGWLIEPSKDIIKTVRASGEEGVIVQKESVDADLQSLKRMALDLARDKLHYGPAQLDDLANKIHLGDLTPILEIYEEDIKTPVKSALSGTLLRSVFVQVQKAKVDIDQTLTGIDRLLKSQELTFAFVGVAPALAILYVTSGYLRELWSGGRGRGRYGGKRKRAAAWLTMRRVERLLISQPQAPGRRSLSVAQHPRRTDTEGKPTIPPLTSGLLLISLSSLRRYAETCLPMRSRLREGFLEDVGDLEDPALDRDEKVKVVERMWRSWGRVLDWERGGGAIGQR
ncbi:hypothetical protein EW146_g1208 [Bondarzewia mesenterica]|uniref:NCA2-domain-containing protein n=1 Tax=Bondarzewia mesenterica TaxID=1095465 RepID=A0A4S4M626_9AGAM|nr:hypothetical protein EW146_g1208 [Bondarzewia mesenterica]